MEGNVLCGVHGSGSTIYMRPKIMSHICGESSSTSSHYKKKKKKRCFGRKVLEVVLTRKEILKRCVIVSLGIFYLINYELG
jgi:hypothetical protein